MMKYAVIGAVVSGLSMACLLYTSEEMNRQLTGRIATYNFSPTPLSEKNLFEEKAHGNTYVTGNKMCIRDRYALRVAV